jgi:Ca-activated chloride channel homolog
MKGGRPVRRGFAGAIAAALAIGLALSAQQRPEFKTGIRTVAIYSTVRDRDGHLVTDLTRDDFQIFDNGHPAEIVTFSNAVVPSTIALLLDMDWSTGMITNHVGEEFTRIRDSAALFVQALLPQDRMRIITIGHGVTPSPLLTSDKSVLRRILAEELWPGHDLTPLWAAIHLSMDSIATESGRKVILVLSQSPDGCSSEEYGEPTMDFYRSRWCQVGHGDVTKQARSGDFMVYAIGTQTTGLQPALADVADDTGGGHFHIKNDADLKSIFAEVANELHHQYAIGIEPAVADGKVHKLATRLRPNGLTAHARQSYMAGPR